jgi:hypothetical protein
MNKLFVYDELLNSKTWDIVKIRPINVQIAESTGKLYTMHRTPYMFKLNDITRNRGLRKVFGAILSFNPDDMDYVLETLDNYKGCSVSRIGIHHPYDLSYRSIETVYPINFTDIHELEDFSYTYGKGVRCYVYLGNPTHSNHIINLKTYRHSKLSQGYYKDFKKLLKKEGYL